MTKVVLFFIVNLNNYICSSKMKLKKIIISFFLLFVYSISFAHSLSYHEHGFYSEHQFEFRNVKSSDHQHEHHTHSLKEELKTDHINHNNHCDDGIFDLITCVLSDLTNHNHNDCHLEHQPNNDTNRVSNQDNLSDIVDVKLVLRYRYSIQYLVSDQLISGLQCPLIEGAPLRGPPIFC